MSHPSKDGVDKLMSHILKAVNLRSESERRTTMGAEAASASVTAFSRAMRVASDDTLREAEYMVYELIDAATQLLHDRLGEIERASGVVGVEGYYDAFVAHESQRS